jgi:tetratricopeptide (TPR) repeat protein
MLCTLANVDIVKHKIAAKAVVEILQYLPLAIAQAASYVREVTKDFNLYLRLYKNRRVDLHNWISDNNRQYSHSVATACSISFDLVHRELPKAAKFLKLLSFLNPDVTLIEFIIFIKNALDNDLHEVGADEIKFAQTLLYLEKFSLLRWSHDRQALSIHHLIQAVLQDQMNEHEYNSWSLIFIKMCSLAFPSYDFPTENLSMHRRYQDQVGGLLMRLNSAQLPEQAEVISRVSWFMTQEGKMRDAEKLCCRTVEVSKLTREATLQLDMLLGLANTYRAQARTGDAAALQEEVLQKRRRILGEELPDTLRSMNNLANTYSDQGRTGEAAALQEEVLQKQRRILGEELPERLRSMNNLALTYSDQGRTGEAAALQHEHGETPPNEDDDNC